MKGEKTNKELQRDVILYYWRMGVRKAKEIQSRTQIKLSTIYYNLKKLERSGNNDRKSGSGRPKKIDKTGTRIIGQNLRRNPYETTISLADKLTNKGIQVGRHTVGRHLHRLGYKNSLPLATPMLTENHKQKRVEWAQKHLNDDWTKTLFSDETSFQLFRNTITKWHKDDRPIHPIPKERKKIYAWGGFSNTGKTNLYCFKEKMDAKLYVDILEKQLPDIEEMMEEGWHLQQDNDPKHTSRLAKGFIEENFPELIDWPSNSPDLNPIENIWSIVKRRVEKRRPRNLVELEEFMIEEWDKTPEEIIKNLTDSMKTRCEAIIEANGDRINY
jgi:transposase